MTPFGKHILWYQQDLKLFINWMHLKLHDMRFVLLNAMVCPKSWNCSKMNYTYSIINKVMINKTKQLHENPYNNMTYFFFFVTESRERKCLYLQNYACRKRYIVQYYLPTSTIWMSNTHTQTHADTRTHKQTQRNTSCGYAQMYH